MNPESTWLGACGQEMELFGLSAPGVCDRHGLLQAELSPCPGPDPGVPTVSLLCPGLCMWHPVHFSWSRLEQGVTQTPAGLIFGEPGHCCPLCHLSVSLECSGSQLRGALGGGFSTRAALGLVQACPRACRAGSRGAGAAHMALIAAGYCCRLRNVPRCPAKVQLPCRSEKGAAELLWGGSELAEGGSLGAGDRTPL